MTRSGRNGAPATMRLARIAAGVLLVGLTGAALTGCSLFKPCLGLAGCGGTVVTPTSTSAPGGGTSYPVHTDIVGTTFWVGEIFDPNADDGSQVLSTYDSNWLANYGGCDGTTAGGSCETEARSAANDYFPTEITPKENPFYLDLPFDDVNDPAAFARRDQVVPWAGQEPYASHSGDSNFSYMKNRWVALSYNGATCYAQIEDAGPGEYNDAEYVFGADDARPLNSRYGGAGMDVSPAVVGCLAFDELNGEQGGISWQFVDDSAVPPGPWTKVVTTSQVQ
ncbi:hypothetical protein N1027_10155 [Herbiconiux sp. CPCC 205763]|uniref:Lipoprotein n=1 Tax=Herbiconiux aconitum TaxID=2970913 RepID=A0ABT2GQK1_9MICO|nr:hypothetical protein [Herbiconiux aconitum]MCS5718499.1 hypothetical protein [Herbiconiux aconitum]